VGGVVKTMMVFKVAGKQMSTKQRHGLAWLMRFNVSIRLYFLHSLQLLLGRR
jgi:hypothetical protein